MSTAPVIKVGGVCKNYGSLQAVKNVSFSADKGNIIALLGPNGAGKSTLMNMIAGYLAPSSGSIEIMGKNIAAFPLYAKENTGFLPEGAPLYADMTVHRFLLYMAELRGLGEKEVEKAEQTANITDVAKQKCDTLSKGYKRRTGFAQSILSDPPLLLLDEPTDGLDPNQKDHIRTLIKNMSADKTIIISTHLLEEAENVCNRIILLDKGVVKADSDLEHLLESTGCKNIAEAFRLLTRKENLK